MLLRQIVSLLFCMILTSAASAQYRVAMLSDGTAAIVTDDELAAPVFRVPAGKIHALNWVLASWLSLNLPLVKDSENRIMVGNHGDSWNFMVSVQHIKKRRSADQRRFEYVFVKGNYELLLNTHDDLDANNEFAKTFEELLGLGGGFLKAGPYGYDVEWLSDDRSSNAWALKQSVWALGVPFKELSYIGETRDGRLAWLGDKHHVDLESEWLHRVRLDPSFMELTIVHASVCNRHIMFPFVVGPGVNLRSQKGKHLSPAHVWSLLQLSIRGPSQPCDMPMVMPNGRAVLYPLFGDNLLGRIPEILSNYFGIQSGEEPIILPIDVGNHWLALVVDRRQGKCPLTILDSRTMPIALTRVLRNAVEKAIGARGTRPTRFVNYALDQDPSLNDFGIVTWLNVISYLGINRIVARAEVAPVYDPSHGQNTRDLLADPTMPAENANVIAELLRRDFVGLDGSGPHSNF